MSGWQFLAPFGLIALISIPAVIIFHMRNTTPVVRDVPSLRFWRMAMRDEHHQERFKKPPVNLLFLLHLLLVGLIAFALARPATSRALGGLGARTEPRHLIVLLDGSTSMAAKGSITGTTRFDTAREIALDRLRDLRQGDVATVVLMGTRATTFEATDEAGLRSIRERIETLSLPGGRADLNAALSLTADLVLPQMRDEIVLISDGALTADPAVVAAIGAPVEFVSAGADVGGNVAITDIATRASTVSAGQQQLYARIVNFGNDVVKGPAVITVDGIEISRADLTIQPGGQAEEIVQDLPAGAASVSVRVEIDDALPADNVASSVLIQGEEFGLRVVLISDVPSALQRALAVLPGANITLMSPPEAAATRLEGAFDLVVYENTLPPTTFPAVPLLIVNPPEAGILATRGVMATPSVQRIRAQDPLLNGVELGGVTFGQTFVHVLDATATEIVGAEAGPLLYRRTAPGGGGPMIVMPFDITQSNLPQRVAFPILVANIANELAPSPLPAAAPLGDPLRYRPRAGAVSVQIQAPTGLVTTLDLSTGAEDPSAGTTQLREVTFTDTGTPGTYLVTEIDAGGASLGGGRFVVNAGHPRESDLTPNLELPQALASVTVAADAGAASSVSDLWPALAAAALAVLLFEWLFTLLPRRRPNRPKVSAARVR